MTKRSGIWESIKSVLLIDPSSGISPNIKNNANSGSNELLVNLEGHQCLENSSNDLLLAGGVFTGLSWQSTLDYGVTSIDISTDQDSATNGLVVQWSHDGVTIDNDLYLWSG